MDIATSASFVTSSAATLPASDGVVDAGYGATLSEDAAAFQNSLKQAGEASPVDSVAEAIFKPLDFLDKEASAIAEYAGAAVQSDNSMRPSEIVSLTFRSQEFLFHSQLTANIATRTADGIQQLFKQQS